MQSWPGAPPPPGGQGHRLSRLNFPGQGQSRKLAALCAMGEMVQNLRPLFLAQGLLYECRQEVSIGMREGLIFDFRLSISHCRLPIVDCRMPTLLISHRFSFQPFKDDFGQSVHNLFPTPYYGTIREAFSCAA
jgi:hypothetical protein